MRRLADYGRYLEYLHLRYAWDVASPTDKAEALRSLARYVWRIYPSEMIHAFRIFQLLARGNKELLDAYAYEKMDAPGWKDVTPVTDEEVFQSVTAGVKQFQPLDYTPRRFSGKLVPLPASVLQAPTLPAPACTSSRPHSLGARIGQVIRVTRISTRNSGSAMAKRSAVAVNGGRPAATILLASTVLPTVIIASVK